MPLALPVSYSVFDLKAHFICSSFFADSTSLAKISYYMHHACFIITKIGYLLNLLIIFKMSWSTEKLGAL